MTASDSSRVAFRVISAGDYNCLQASNLAISNLLILHLIAERVLSESKYASPLGGSRCLKLVELF